MEPKIEFKKIRDFGETINDTFVFLKQNFLALLKTYFIYCGFFVLAHIISTALLKLGMAGYGDNGYPRYDFRMFLNFNYYLSLLAALLLQSAVSTAIISYIKIYVEKGNEKPTTEEVWGYFKYYYLRVLGSTIILMLLLCVAAILCFFPAVWLFPIISMFFPIMICENGTFGYAFNKMFKVVSGNWWTIFATLLVIWIITAIGSAVVSIPSLIIEMGSAFGPAAVISKPLTIISATATGLAQTLSIIPIICAAFCYYSQVERQERTGLFDRINHFGQQYQDRDNTTEEY